MDWTVYWFMLPVCVVVATTAMFSGISGAALLTPFFVLGFPVMGVPTLSLVEAIGTSLFLETPGFGSGVLGNARRRLPDWSFGRRLLVVAVPAGAVGAVLAMAGASSPYSSSGSAPPSSPRPPAGRESSERAGASEGRWRAPGSTATRSSSS